MRFVKHNAIENFNQFSQKEKAILLVEEMSKACMLYPEAIADILDSSNIKYRSKHPKDLAKAISDNSDNLKMLNRVVRVSFLVNKDGGANSKKINRQARYRDVMRQGKSFLKQYPAELKESTLIARDMMKENLYSKVLNKTMTNYLNMDGQTDKKEVRRVEKSNNNTALIVIGLLAVVGFIYFKSNKK